MLCFESPLLKAADVLRLLDEVGWRRHVRRLLILRLVQSPLQQYALALLSSLGCSGSLYAKTNSALAKILLLVQLVQLLQGEWAAGFLYGAEPLVLEDVLDIQLAGLVLIL